MRSIYDVSIKDLQEYLEKNSVKAFHAKQIFRWIYDKRIDDFDLMSDLSKDLIARLKEDFSISPLTVKDRQISKDGT